MLKRKEEGMLTLAAADNSDMGCVTGPASCPQTTALQESPRPRLLKSVQRNSPLAQLAHTHRSMTAMIAPSFMRPRDATRTSRASVPMRTMGVGTGI